MEGPSGGSKEASEAKRYLQNLGKKLLQTGNSGRWSLKEGREDKEALEDMGLSLLEQKETAENEIDDIENHSPNLQRTLKRSYSKANVSSSDTKNSPLRERDVVPAKIKLTDVQSPSRIYKFGSSITTDVPSCSSMMNNVNNKKDRTAEYIMNREKNELIESISSHTVIENNAVNYNISMTINDNLGDKSINTDLLHVSPLTTCGPHPPFHKYHQSMTRHATFDENNPDDPRNETNDGSQFDEINTTIVTTDIDYKCEGALEFDPDKTIFPKEEENSGIRDLHKSSEISEQECFVLQNLSFCTSCDNKSALGLQDDHTIFNQEKENGFSKLFDELVLSIFQWLPKKMLMRCMLVCKRWHRLALDSRLWSRVCLGGRVLSSGALSNLMTRHPIVLRLANAQLIAPVIPDIAPSMEWRVQYLDLSAASISPECLAQILNCCPSLLRLSLEGLALCEEAAIALGRLTNLRVLNLALTTNLGIAGARALTHIPRLEALNVAWTRLSYEATKELCNGLSTSLQRLNLSGFRKTLTEKLVETVVIRCPDLVELDLSDCIMMGDRLIPILFGLKSLEHLAISRCHRLKRSDFILLNDFPCLQWVDVFGLVSPLAPITLCALSQLLPKIKLNQFVHSAIARPTVGNRRTSIWGLRTRD